MKRIKIPSWKILLVPLCVQHLCMNLRVLLDISDVNQHQDQDHVVSFPPKCQSTHVKMKSYARKSSLLEEDQLDLVVSFLNLDLLANHVFSLILNQYYPILPMNRKVLIMTNNNSWNSFLCFYFDYRFDVNYWDRIVHERVNNRFV